jgi:hypothetical protein
MEITYKLCVSFFQVQSAIFGNTYFLKEHDWPLYKFENPPRKLWEDLKEQRDFLDQIGKKVHRELCKF